jgi:hypothetical protein
MSSVIICPEKGEVLGGGTAQGDCIITIKGKKKQQARVRIRFNSHQMSCALQ